MEGGLSLSTQCLVPGFEWCLWPPQCGCFWEPLCIVFFFNYPMESLDEMVLPSLKDSKVSKIPFPSDGGTPGPTVFFFLVAFLVESVFSFFFFLIAWLVESLFSLTFLFSFMNSHLRLHVTHFTCMPVSFGVLVPLKKKCLNKNAKYLHALPQFIYNWLFKKNTLLSTAGIAGIS